MKIKLLTILLLAVSVTFAQAVSIADARAAAEGTTVTTSGIVTTPNMAAVGESDFTIQDETAGIVIYTGDFDAALTVGDSVTISGEIDSYNGKLEIVPSVGGDIVVNKQGVDLPAFQYVTISGLLTDAESFESELVQIYNVSIVGGEDWPEELNNANVLVTDDDSVNTLILRVDRHSDVDGQAEPTSPFDVKGVITQYDWNTPAVSGYQIMPRYYTDIETPDANIKTVLAARNTAVGTSVTTRGFITTPSFSSSKAEFALQDATGGIYIYGSALSPTDLAEGDFITITGPLDFYNGLTQIKPAALTDITVIDSNCVIPAVQELSIEDILNSPESIESELVKVSIAQITGGTWPTSGSESMTITDVSDSSMTLRIDSATDIPGQAEPTGTMNITGIIGQYDYTDPYDSGYRLFPRYYADFEVLGDIAPIISNVVHTPTNPTPNDIVTITADVVDDGTVTVSLDYKVDAGAYQTIAMTATTGSGFTGDIPAQVDGSIVSYYVHADDAVNEVVYSDTLVYASRAPESLTPIYDIQYTTNSSGDSPMIGQTVTIGGIVTAEFWGGSYNSNMFVQDADGPWNGILVYRYAGWDSFDFVTPVGDTVHTVAEGDSVVIKGTVKEYSGLTEIDPVTEIIVFGPAVNQITPSVVTPGQIMTDGTDAEAYEGCLVKVVDVTIDNPDLGYGEWTITDGNNSVRVDDIWDYYFWPMQDSALTEVVGCLTYNYSDTKIEPRLARDIVEAGDVRIQRAQQVLYSDLLKVGDDALSDISYMFGDTVTITGIVTMPTGLSYAGDGVKFLFADEHGGPWSGIMSYDPDSSQFPVLREGYNITATGYIEEYTTGPSNMTEFFITKPVKINGIGDTPPVSKVSTGDLRWPTTAEQWGTVIVQIEDAVVIDNELSYGEWSVDDGTGSVNVDDDSDSLETFTRPPNGTVVDSIRGWVYHHYGYYTDSTAYKLEPLYVNDIHLGTVGVGDETQVPKTYALYHNYPNPFNPETQIQFRIGASEQVKLVIYDITGREIRTLINNDLNTGLHTITWNGKNNRGTNVASGMYIYRIKAGNFSKAQKMLLIR